MTGIDFRNVVIPTANFSVDFLIYTLAHANIYMPNTVLWPDRRQHYTQNYRNLVDFLETAIIRVCLNHVWTSKTMS